MGLTSARSAVVFFFLLKTGSWGGTCGRARLIFKAKRDKDHDHLADLKREKQGSYFITTRFVSVFIYLFLLYFLIYVYVTFIECKILEKIDHFLMTFVNIKTCSMQDYRNTTTSHKNIGFRDMYSTLSSTDCSKSNHSETKLNV